MDPYLLLKLAHVATAIVWVGGASVFLILIILLMRKGDDEATLRCLSYLGLLGNRVFAPVGLFTILSGATLAWLGAWGWAAWVVLAVGTVAVTFTLGATVLGPASDRCVRMWREGDTPGAMALGRTVLRFARFDLAAQWAIIGLMVLKPGWTDPLLAVLAALVTLGALSLLASRPQPVAQPA